MPEEYFPPQQEEASQPQPEEQAPSHKGGRWDIIIGIALVVAALVIGYLLWRYYDFMPVVNTQ